MLEAGMPEEDFAAYDRRLRLVEAVYQDRVRRKPEMPWDEAISGFWHALNASKRAWKRAVWAMFGPFWAEIEVKTTLKEREDLYRRCEYTVDYDAGRFTVTPFEGAVEDFQVEL